MKKRKLNIYDFFNSPDVAEYCKSINHTFNALESAIIINKNVRCTFEEKLAAYKTIIAQYPDMEIPKSCHYGHIKSFHKRLEGMITNYECFLEKFFSTEQKTVFQYRIKFTKDSYEPQWLDESICFATYKKALADGLKRIKDNDFSRGFLYMEIQKKYLNKIDCLSVVVNKSGKILNINACADAWSDWDDLLCSFYIDVPVPFKVGDLLEDSTNDSGWMGNVFVLQKISNKGSDTSDMTAGVFYESNGTVGCECIHFYPDLQYCRSELKEQQRILKYVSLQVQGKLCHCALLKIQKYLMLDELISVYKNDSELKYQLRELEDNLLESPISNAKIDKMIETLNNCQSECTEFGDESGNYDEIKVLQTRLDAINDYLNYIKPFMLDLKQN